jgi:hypothetical protein
LRGEDGADAPGTTAEIARWTGEAHDGSEVEKGKTIEKTKNHLFIIFIKLKNQ